MTTEELRKKIEADGLERILERYDEEPDDDEELRELFQMVSHAWTGFHEAAAIFEKRLRADKEVQL